MMRYRPTPETITLSDPFGEDYPAPAPGPAEARLEPCVCAQAKAPLRRLVVDVVGRRTGVRPGPVITNSFAAGNAILSAIPEMAEDHRERFVILLLNAKNQVVGVQDLVRGRMSSVDVPLVPLLQTILLFGVPAFITAHNHPTGNPTPSPEDDALQKALYKAAGVVGLRMLDFLVLARDLETGTDRVFSYADAGKLG